MAINYRGGEGIPPLPPIKIARFIAPGIVILILLMVFNSLFYQVDKDEAGVVQRFGKYVRTTHPGLHMKLPFGIETVKNIKVTYVFKEEFGFRTVTAGVRSVFAGRDEAFEREATHRRYVGPDTDPFLQESLMLSGDLNVAIVEWIVQYTVKDPVQFAFRVREPRETIRNMSEAGMRLVIGDRTINEILTSGREEIQTDAKERLQGVFDSYGIGISVRNIILQDVTPPNEVKPSFNEVNEARQDKEKLVNQAWEEYNRVIPKAKGQAEQQIREAEGYSLERINKSKGDAERFLLTWEAYRKAPEVTRKRLYLEMAKNVFPSLKDKIFIDESQQGILPLLHLNQEKEQVPS